MLAAAVSHLAVGDYTGLSFGERGPCGISRLQANAWALPDLCRDENKPGILQGLAHSGKHVSRRRSDFVFKIADSALA